MNKEKLQKNSMKLSLNKKYKKLNVSKYGKAVVEALKKAKFD